MPLLDPADLERIERLAIGTRTRLLGFFSGEHRSRRMGSSVDFADFREYRPGDDFRRIDPNLSARLDRTYLRLFEAEEDIPVRIVVDTSASMGFGAPPKSGLALRLAAALAHIALTQGDRVRVYAAAGGSARAGRWHTGKGEIGAIMDWLASQHCAAGPGLHGSLRAIREEGHAGATILISDLLDPDWEIVLPRLAFPGEAAVIHVLSPDEESPPLEGDLTLVDAETGAEVSTTITPAALRAYERRLAAWRAAVRSTCTSHGIAFAEARSDEDVVDLLMRRFRRAKVVHG